MCGRSTGGRAKADEHAARADALRRIIDASALKHEGVDAQNKLAGGGNAGFTGLLGLGRGKYNNILQQL